MPIMFMFMFHSPSLSHLKSLFCSGGKTQIEHHGTKQLSLPEHQLDGGHAAQWWSIPSDVRITLDLPPYRQSSSETGDGGTHRLYSTHQSAPDRFAARYHHLSFVTQHLLDVTWCCILTPKISNRFRTEHHFPIPHRQLPFHLDHLLQLGTTWHL